MLTSIKTTLLITDIKKIGSIERVMNNQMYTTDVIDQQVAKNLQVGRNQRTKVVAGLLKKEETKTKNVKIKRIPLLALTM